MSRNSNRNGAAILDVIVAATLIMATLAIAAPMVIGSARTWKQTRNVQVACDELAAKMDWLVSMPANERQAAIEKLTVSDIAQRRLTEPTLVGEIIDDRDGKRIKLAINWKRPSNPPPLSLIAWVQPLEAKTREPDKSDLELQGAGTESGGTS